MSVEEVFKAAPGCQKVLMAALEACRTPRTPSELDSIMDEVLRCNRSVYRPAELRALLERYGALAYEPSEEEQAAQAALETGGEPELVVDEDGNFVTTAPTEGVWAITEAGAAYLDSDPIGAKAQALLAKDAVYLPVYRALLEFAAECPRDKSAIDAVIDPHPLVQNPRLFAGYFLGELERIDAMEWADAWHVTERGLDLLEALRDGEDDESGVAEALRQQSAAYGFVARLLRTEVDDEALGRLRAMRFPAASGNDHLDAGYRGLCAYLNAGGERQHGDLAVDFLHTFIGVTQDREQVAFPYESVYTSPEHLLMQDARDEVLAAYRAAKVVLVDEACEPEDHLAFELEFMQLLGERAAEALEAGDDGSCANLLEARRAFLEEHLLNWVPDFADDVQRVARTGFYRALADIVLGVLETDQAFLEDVLDDAA